MNILLIDPPGWQKHSLNLGLAYLAGSLRAADLKVQILDLNNHSYSEDALKKIIAEYQPKFIGVSVKTATANVSAQIIRKIKNIFPQIVFTVGGPHITLCGKEFMEANPEVNFAITGEGEGTLVNLLRSEDKEIGQINGLYYRKDKEVVFNNHQSDLDITKLAFPQFEYIRDMDFIDFRYPLLTSRGCPQGCIFCCVGLISGKKWRARSPEDIVKELLQAKDKYQTSSFEIMDDNFTFDIARAKEICRLIIKTRIDLPWWCHNGLRADKLDQNLLFLMKKSGCQSIALGIESGDEGVFNNINKGEKLSDIVKAVKMVKKAGIKCVGYFIVGLPGDSVASTKNTVKFQRNLKLADYKYNLLVPYPGTRVAQLIKQSGRMLVDIEGIYHFGDEIKIPFETSDISKKTIEDCYYLANHQDWVYEDSNLTKIKRFFKSRFGKDAQRIIFINDHLGKTPRNIEIEFEQSVVLEIKPFLALVSTNQNNEYIAKYNGNSSYFETVVRLKHEKGCQIIFNHTGRKLFLEKMEEYVRGESLPDAQGWDDSAKKYFATRLKYHSADINSPNNGIIYKDNIALPYSHAPQFEKHACGKIESGLAFISTAAFNPKSKYTVDYVAQKLDLIKIGSEHLTLEKIVNESDILFCPSSLKHFALFISEAKMNVIYYHSARQNGSLDFIIGELDSEKISYYIIKRIKQIYYRIRGGIIQAITEFLILVKKCAKVSILWIQIIFFIVLSNIRKLFSKIVRF